MMRHLQFTRDDSSERPRFSTLITKGPAFWFDMSDITHIRTEFSTLIDNLSKLYLQEEEKAPREQAQRCAKQKKYSKNVNHDAAMSTSKDEGNVEGDLARASVEKENSSPPPTTMTLVGPQPTNPPHPLLQYQSKTIRGNYDYDRELFSIDTVPAYILSKLYVFGQGKCQLSGFFSMQQICHVLRKTTCTISGS
jgi:hypothetical protein